MLALTLSAACNGADSNTNDATSSALCEPEEAPRGGHFERCSESWQCDDSLLCTWDAAVPADYAVSICEPQGCTADADCVDFGEFKPACDGDGLCYLPCNRMQDCPVGMFCTHQDGAVRCMWPS